MKKLLSFALTLTFVFALVIGSVAFATPKTTKVAKATKVTKSTKVAKPTKKIYVDGSYNASYDAFDVHNYKAQTTITIKNDKIIAAKFDYISTTGKLKTQDKAYNDSMQKVQKTSPKIYCPQLSKELVVSQNVAKVDTITGATTSSNNFKALATAALANAKKGIKTVAIIKEAK